MEAFFSEQDIFWIIETYINGNRNDAVDQMKKLNQMGQADELIEQLTVYKKEFQIEMLSYFYKNY